MNSQLRAEKLKLCVGCRENFYNGKNSIGVSECWHLESAQIVKRWRLQWWTSPITPGAFVQVRTLSCHHQPGRYAFCKELPDHAVESVRLQKETP